MSISQGKWRILSWAHRGVLVCGFTWCLALASAQAANLTWNGGVSGAWQNGAGGWLNGGSAANWNNATPDAAIFSGTAPTSVSVDAGGVTAGNLTVSAGTYSLGGSGTLTLSSSTIDVGSGLTTTLSAALAGTTGLTKSGAGTLTMSGANKSYSGTTTITGGSILISAVAAGNLGSSTTGTVSLNGGALHGSFSANATVAYVILVGNSGGELRNLGSDSQRWVIGSNDKIQGAGTLTVSFGSNSTRVRLGSTSHPNFTGKWIVDSGGSGARYLDLESSSNLGAASGDDALTLKNTGTLLLRGFTLGSGTQGITIGSGGAKIEGAGGAVNTIAGKISGGAGNPLEFYIGNATSVMVLSNPNNSWLGATTLASSAAGALLRLGAAGVFPDLGGTVTVNSTATLNLNGYSETIGGLSGSGTVINSTGSATLTVGANGASTSFSGTLQDGGGTLSLAKTGGGTLTLINTTKNYTGATTISGGAIQIAGASPGSLGQSATGTVNLNGGALYGNFAANTDVAYVIVVGAGGGELRNLGGYDQRWVVSGEDKIQGSGTLTVSFGSSNTRVQFGTTSHPNFTGKWIVDSGGNANRFADLGKASVNLGAATGDDALTLRNTGTVLLRGDTLGSALQGVTIGSGGAKLVVAGNTANVLAAKVSGASSNPLEFYLETGSSVLTLTNANNAWLGETTINAGGAGGTLRLGTSGVFPDAGANVLISATAVLNLNGWSETIGGLDGSGTVRNSTGAATLTFGANNNSPTFSGTLEDGGGVLSIRKVGSGHQTLSGANTYSGRTTVEEGALQFNQATLPANNDVYLTSGVTLTLNFIGANTIRKLFVDGVSQFAGVYNSANEPAGIDITGNGSLVVTAFDPPPCTVVRFQ